MERRADSTRNRRPFHCPLWLWYAPELAHCRSHFEFTEATARQKRGPLGPLIGPLFVYLAAIALLVFAPQYFVPASLGRYGPLIAIMALSLLFSLWASVQGRDRARRGIRAYLLARGIPLCQNCGYDLSATPASEQPRCPECGEPFPDRGVSSTGEASA
jgi:hypothetical protein